MRRNPDGSIVLSVADVVGLDALIVRTNTNLRIRDMFTASIFARAWRKIRETV